MWKLKIELSCNEMFKSARNCSKIATIKHLTQNLEWQITFKVNFLFLALNAYIGFVEEVMIPCRILALMAESRPVIFELIPG